MDDKTMKQLEMEMAIHNMVENMHVFIEHQQVLAKLRKVKYDSLLSEGFSEEQALHITTYSKILE